MKAELLHFEITFFDENGKFILTCGEYAYNVQEAENKARRGIAKDKRNGHFQGVTFAKAKTAFFPGTRYGRIV